MVPTRRALVWLLISCALWAFVVLHVTHGFRRASWHTELDDGDHYSHAANALIFLDRGFEIFRHPGTFFCTSPRTPEVQRFTAQDCQASDVCSLRYRPADRPLCVVWAAWAQPYPPGLLLYSLPDGLLYRFTHLSFEAVNLFSLFKYILAAHLLVWILFRMLFAPARDDDLPGGVAWNPIDPWLRWGLFGLLYLDTMKWAIDGFYDPIAVAPVFLAVYFLIKQRGTDALLSLAVTMFLHFRGLWYAPLVLFAVWQIVVGREWRERPSRTGTKLVLAALMFGFAGYAFLLLRSTVAAFPHTNPAFSRGLVPSKAPLWSFGVPVVMVVWYLLWARQWALASVIAWQTFTLVQTPQVMPWHTLFLVPLFALARWKGERGAQLATLVFYVAEITTVFGFDGLPLPGQLLSALVTHWGPMHW